MKTRTLLLLAGCCTLVFSASAADWPQWRGPDRTGISSETGLLKSWPKSGPSLAWTFEEAGTGYGSMAIVGDRVYSTGTDGTNENVYALDLKTGKLLWKTAMAPHARVSAGDGPRSTPTVDGERVFALGSQGDLVCVAAATGEKVWAVGLKKDLSGSMMSGWGYSESPLIDGDRIICTPGGKQGTLAALDKTTGKVIWRSSAVTDSAGYSSVVIATLGGVRQYVQVTGQSAFGVTEKGDLLWRYTRSGPTSVATTPVVHDDHVFLTSAYGAPCNLIKITRGDSGLKAEPVYVKKDVLSNHHGGVVLVGDHLYGYHGGNDWSRVGKWVCVEYKTGEIKWNTGVKDKLPKGSLTCADGLLFCYSEQSGAVAVIEASPEGWKEHGRLTLPKNSKSRRPTWSHPVVANGKLFLRDQELLYCYDIKSAN